MTSTTLIIFVAVAAMMSTSTSKSIVRHAAQHKTHRLEFEDDEFQNSVEDDDERRAFEHTIAVAEIGSCNDPKPQVVHVSDHYHDPTKYYLPGCTVLHRCGKHAGCCGTDRLQCVAAKKEKVTLYFYSVRILGDALPAEQKVEKLVFTNHTRCGCVLKKDDHGGEYSSLLKNDDSSLEKTLVSDDFDEGNSKKDEEEASLEKDNSRDNSQSQEKNRDSNISTEHESLDGDLSDLNRDKKEDKNLVDEEE